MTPQDQTAETRAQVMERLRDLARDPALHQSIVDVMFAAADLLTAPVAREPESGSEVLAVYVFNKATGNVEVRPPVAREEPSAETPLCPVCGASKPEFRCARCGYREPAVDTPSSCETAGLREALRLVDSLETALKAAYSGSAEHGSFLRHGGGEYTPSVFWTLERLRAALAGDKP